MTRAAWNASIEAQGVLTIAMSVVHIQQAIQDGDAALVGTLLAGTAITAPQATARTNIYHGLDLYGAANVTNPAAIVGAAARTQLIAQGDGYYGTTGAP
jgi:hypothetical protein